MLICFSHDRGDGYIFWEDNKVESSYVSNNTRLFSLLMKLRRKGIPKIIKYSCKGQPRRRTIYKPVKDVEQILEFLHSIAKEYGIHNIEILDGDKN